MSRVNPASTTGAGPSTAPTGPVRRVPGGSGMRTTSSYTLCRHGLSPQSGWKAIGSIGSRERRSTAIT